MITGNEFMTIVFGALVLIGLIGLACSKPSDESTTDLDDKDGIWKGENEL